MKTLYYLAFITQNALLKYGTVLLAIAIIASCAGCTTPPGHGI